MGQVIWAPSALRDIDLIAEYIARDSTEQASLFVTRLIQATDRLGEFPGSGRIIPEIRNTACREIICSAYRIMYRIEGDEVWITGVVHGAQKFRAKSRG
jgi:addiction module RelE/StbE family toxin